MIKHFITFVHAGAIVSEEYSQEIESWNVDKAIELYRGLSHKPFAFYFTTKEQKDGVWGIKEIAKSEKYYINGTVKTLQDVKDENNPANENLIWNMEHNNYPKIVIVGRSFIPFDDRDKVINL